MLAFGVLISSALLVILFLAYCLIGLSRASGKRKRRYPVLARQYPSVTCLPDDTRRSRDSRKITRLAVAGLSLSMPATLVAQSGPANCTVAPARRATPAMVGPLSIASPKTFDAGPLGTLDFTGTLNGFGSWQGHPSSGDKTARADISNAQIFVQKTSGLVQYFLQAGVYNIRSKKAFPAVGDEFGAISTNSTQVRGVIETGFMF